METWNILYTVKYDTVSWLKEWDGSVSIIFIILTSGLLIAYLVCVTNKKIKLIVIAWGQSKDSKVNAKEEFG